MKTTDPMAKARWRPMQGQKFDRAATCRRVIQQATGLSEAQISRLAKGDHAVAYEHVDALARNPNGKPESLVAGQLAVILHARRDSHDAAELGLILRDSLNRHQQHDGDEDCDQGPLMEALGALPFVGCMTLPRRRELIRRLEAWVEDATCLVDETLTSIVTATALVEKLRGEVVG